MNLNREFVHIHLDNIIPKHLFPVLCSDSSKFSFFLELHLLIYNGE